MSQPKDTPAAHSDLSPEGHGFQDIPYSALIYNNPVKVGCF